MSEHSALALSILDAPSIGWSGSGDRLGPSTVAPLHLSGSPAVSLPADFLLGIDPRRAGKRMPAAGDPQLLEGLARHFYTRSGVEFDPASEILVTNGAMQALDCVFRALVADGSTIGFVNPTFFADRLLAGRVRIVGFETRPEQGWHITDELLDQIAATALDALFLVNPNNPTGVVYTEQELKALADAAPGAVIISDEAYEAFVYDGRRHVSLHSVDAVRDRVVTIQSFTKSFGLVGARIGCVAGPAHLLQRVRRVLGWLTLASNPLSQSLAIAALEAGDAWRHRLVSQFDVNRTALQQAVSEGTLPDGTNVPEGATFSTLDISSLGVGSEDASRRLWAATGIACVPGVEFPGAQHVTDRFVRLPIGAPEPVFQEALRRLAVFFAGSTPLAAHM